MSTDTTVTPLRQRMIEDMTARKLGPHSQRSYIHSCRRFAAFLKRSPDTATADDVRRSNSGDDRADGAPAIPRDGSGERRGRALDITLARPTRAAITSELLT